MSTDAEIRRSTWKAKVFRDDDEKGLAEHDAEFWASIPIDERAEVAWQLSRELWSLADAGSGNEQGLQRASTSPRRG